MKNNWSQYYKLMRTMYKYTGSTKNFIKMKHNFKEYYKFPLKREEYDTVYVWTVNSHMALQFPLKGIHQKIFELTIKQKTAIVNIINGTPTKIDIDFSKIKDNAGDICIKNKVLFTIRGWGMLTGRGGFNLHTDKAIEIQEDFIDYIIDKLKTNEV